MDFGSNRMLQKSMDSWNTEIEHDMIFWVVGNAG